MYSSCDTPKGGFPHSEISGSKLICQLPEAYRRLSRLSSPIIAKASTMCSYSLDPITLISLTRFHRCFKECLSGLSPDALCRKQLQLFRAFIVNFESQIKVLPSKFDIRFDAIKTCCQPLLRARSALNLYECAVSLNSLQLATLIKLYKFLKNSRESFDSLLVDIYQPTTKQPISRQLCC
jgi:hypothetical protein